MPTYYALHQPDGYQDYSNNEYNPEERSVLAHKIVYLSLGDKNTHFKWKEIDFKYPINIVINFSFQ